MPGKYMRIDGITFYIGFKVGPEGWREIIDKIHALEDIRNFIDQYPENYCIRVRGKSIRV
jgi:hypothetical protein